MDFRPFRPFRPWPAATSVSGGPWSRCPVETAGVVPQRIVPGKAWWPHHSDDTKMEICLVNCFCIF